jgi:hypothetical protein
VDGLPPIGRTLKALPPRVSPMEQIQNPHIGEIRGLGGIFDFIEDAMRR